jgi:hypothetical protein
MVNTAPKGVLGQYQQMGKRTGKPRGRPPKSEGALILWIRNRPEGESVEDFCEKNYARLGGDPDKMGADVIKRYYGVVSEYPPDHVFEMPSRFHPWVKVKVRALSGTAALWPRKRKPSKKRD